MPALESVAADVRFAVRMLVRDRRFALSALLVLGLGIGVNNMYFTLIYGHTMRGLPMKDADRVLFIATADERGADRPLSYPELELARRAQSFESVAAFSNGSVTVIEDGRAADRYQAAFLTANAISVAGIQPVIGLGLAADNDAPGAQLVALVSEEAWRTRYGGNSSALGQRVSINGVPASLVGVMPDRSGLPSTADVWLPLSAMPSLARDQRDVRNLQAFGRLRDGVTLAAAQSEIDALFNRLDSSPAAPTSGDKPVRAHLGPISERFFGQPTDPAWIAFIAAAGLILLVSSANAANLMIARSGLRAREIAIRASIGASRARVFRQLLTESVVLAGAAGALGVGVSLVGVRLIQTLVPPHALPYWLHYSMDVRVLAALVVVTALTIVIFGLLPAIYASRADVNQLLKSGGQTGRRSRVRWLTDGLLVAEFALAIVLLSYGVNGALDAGPPVASDRVINAPALLTASITLPAATYPTAVERGAFYRSLSDRIAATSGVDSSTMAATLPLRGAQERVVELDGRASDPQSQPRAWTTGVGANYFRTLQLPMIAGRELASSGDDTAGNVKAIVNDTFVRTFMPAENPLGRHLRLSAVKPGSPAGDWLTIVGVAPDVRQRANDDADPMVYVPFLSESPATAALMLRARADQPAVARQLRDAIRQLDPALPLERVMPLPQAIDEVLWARQMSVRLMSLLISVALLVATFGLYAVTAHGVASRAREIGIRVALGAGRWQVRGLVLRRAARQMIIGLVAGVICTIAWESTLGTGETGFSLVRPANLAVITAFITMLTIAGCLVPLRRATRVEAATVLRQDG